jgi:hypothetical protein
MVVRFFISGLFILFVLDLKAQNKDSLWYQWPEILVGTNADLVVHQGLKIGVNYPIHTSLKEKAVERQERVFNKLRINQLTIGTNMSFYHQKKNHMGFLYNSELAFRSIKNKSDKAKRFKYFEAGLGLGYFNYQLDGQTFTYKNGSFEKTKGNGSVFMPSIFITLGRNIKLHNSLKTRFYFKPIFALEIPFPTGLLPHYMLESGFACSLNPKKIFK